MPSSIKHHRITRIYLYSAFLVLFPPLPQVWEVFLVVVRVVKHDKNEKVQMKNCKKSAKVPARHDFVFSFQLDKEVIGF